MANGGMEEVRVSALAYMLIYHRNSYEFLMNETLLSTKGTNGG